MLVALVPDGDPLLRRAGVCPFPSTCRGRRSGGVFSSIRSCSSSRCASSSSSSSGYAGRCPVPLRSIMASAGNASCHLVGQYCVTGFCWRGSDKNPLIIRRSDHQANSPRGSWAWKWAAIPLANRADTPQTSSSTRAQGKAAPSESPHGILSTAPRD